MEKTTHSVSILQEEYDSFRSMLKEELPETYDEWHEIKLKENSRLTANGINIVEVVVHPQEFVDFCRDCGQPESLFLLGGLSIAKSRREEITENE
jgi:hypothetical protein